MSWDILILNSKVPVDFEKGDWPDFKSRQEVINDLKKSFPDITFIDSGLGNIDNVKYNIEFNIGDNESIGNNFMLHVRGNTDPIGEIIRMCIENNWIAFDISGEHYLNPDSPDKNSFKQWGEYRNLVVADTKKIKRPWWKFW